MRINLSIYSRVKKRESIPFLMHIISRIKNPSQFAKLFPLKSNAGGRHFH
ncbi:hypothetical protein [Streptomyces sp. NBC_01789]|nr:hypothetical protein [Streptomyces sp. NBC_01789]MCX4451589.1 hypothetical protein [Streptomyces sp. NBC_01789]